MTLPDMLLIDGIEYRRADRDRLDEPGHCPTPWTWSDEEGTFRDPDGCSVWLGNSENTRLILRAVNHHAELLAFVERVTNHWTGTGICVSISDEAKILLSKVKGT